MDQHIAPSYLHPPIIEAVVEFRFENAISLEQRRAAGRKLNSRYPQVTELVTKEATVDLQNETIDAISEMLVRRSSPDGTGILVIGENRVSISQTAPYSGWSEFSAEVRDAYLKIKEYLGYRKLARVGMRFVNRFDLPMVDGARVLYEDYLNFRVNLPNDFHDLSNYNIEIGFPLFDRNGGASIRSSVLPPALVGRASFSLDIDVWKRENLPAKDVELFELLSELRSNKNRLFEIFITDKARSLFNAA